MKALKWIGIGVGVLVALILIGVIGIVVTSNSQINTEYDVADYDFEVPSGDEAIAEGARLAWVRGCNDCHGASAEGGLFIDDPALGTFYAPNLTPGGEVADFEAADWARAVRHGVGTDDKGLWIMPATDYYTVSDEDLGLLVAYFRSLDPVDETYPEPVPGPIGRMLVATGGLPFPAQNIPHDAARPVPPEPGVTVEYGEYLSTTCVGCHGGDLAGGTTPDAPDSIKPNLTPTATGLGAWTEEDFRDAIRTGLTPEGDLLDAEIMPWPAFAFMTDDEIAALYLYLQSLEPLPQNTGNALPYIPAGG